MLYEVITELEGELGGAVVAGAVHLDEPGDALEHLLLLLDDVALDLVGGRALPVGLDRDDRLGDVGLV